MVGSVDTAGGAADVGVLAGVFLHVSTLDRDGEHRAVFELDLDRAFSGDGLIRLAGLEVLWHVRVEVVLPSEAAGLCDFAAQCQADLDRVFHALLVDDGKGAGQAQ